MYDPEANILIDIFQKQFATLNPDHATYMHLFCKKHPNGTLGEIIVENSKSTVQVGKAKNRKGKFPFLQVVMYFLNGTT